MPILTVHTVILTFGKLRLSLSPLTGQQYILLKNPDQYLEAEEEAKWKNQSAAYKGFMGLVHVVKQAFSKECIPKIFLFLNQNICFGYSKELSH